MFVDCVVLLFTRHLVPKIYSEDPEVISIAANIIVFVAFVTIIDGIQAVSAGILRGVGRPTPGTVCNLVGHYAIGIPLAATLAFGFKMGIYGLWIGLFFGLLVVSIMLVTFVIRIDWEKAVKDAQQRTHEKPDIKFTEMDHFSAGDDDDIPEAIITQQVGDGEDEDEDEYESSETSPLEKKSLKIYKGEEDSVHLLLENDAESG